LEEVWLAKCSRLLIFDYKHNTTELGSSLDSTPTSNIKICQTSNTGDSCPISQEGNSGIYVHALDIDSTLKGTV